MAKELSEQHRVDIDVRRTIVSTWQFSPEQIGAAWLIVLQHYQNGRTFEYYDNSRARRVLLGMSDRRWKTERKYIVECYEELLSATRLKVQYGRQPIPPAVRLAVYKRDGRACVYCSIAVAPDEFHCDHVLPVAQGGSNDPGNLVCACIPCNLSKSAKTPEQWRGAA